MNANPYGTAVVDFSQALQPSAVKAFFSTRQGGVSLAPYASLNLSTATGDCQAHVAENLRRIEAVAGWPKRWLRLKQVHGDHIVVDDGRMQGLVGEGDGLITAYADVALSTYHADCYPIFCACSKSGLIGLAHAGWQGTYKRIGPKLLQEMCVQGASLETVSILVGPGISQAAYQVSRALAEDFVSAFSNVKGEAVVLESHGSYYLNLAACIELSLMELGIQRHQIRVSGACTFGDSAHYYSHRRDGVKTGRMMAVIRK